jgi:AcrR family transcriptional regulator
MNVTSDRVRRTQADRTATTRAALADAAIEVLIERGWAAVTAVEVCNRAGVTRGAFHHHYDSLPALLADALQRLYDEMRQQPRPAISDLVGMIESNWSSIGQPRFKAVIEAWLAMANNPDLQIEIGPVVAEFAALVHPAKIARTILTDAQRRDFFAMARETMLGLALGRATNGGRPLGHEGRVLARLRADAAALDARTAAGRKTTRTVRRKDERA